MKTNYNFPYLFEDLRSIDKSYFSFENENEILKVTINLSNYIDIIQNNDLDILAEFENSSTFFRKNYILNHAFNTLNINLNVSGYKLNYSLFVVSNKTGNIKCRNGSLDYHEKGDYLAILENNSINFINDEGLSGLIKVTKTNKNNIGYDLTSDWITIELPTETYEKFIPWQRDDKTIPIIIGSLAFSCIQYAILMVVRNEQFKDRKWWEIISKLLEENDYSSTDIEEDLIPEMTNAILNNCIQRMIDAFLPDVNLTDTEILS